MADEVKQMKPTETARNIGPLIPWCCTIWIEGRQFGITLYATDPEQIEQDHPCVVVDGRFIASYDWGQE
ncbi:MAG: hypothetical protein EP341_09725 [Sphingomonadales bacterium]|nr:MAG: hypothetical protein EP341_09725 [Sphingomonadales bacterium]